MTRINISDLYLSDEQQLLDEITDGEMKMLAGREGNTVTPSTSDINQPSLASRLDNNIDSLLFGLRNQMNVAIFGARSQYNEGLNRF